MTEVPFKGFTSDCVSQTDKIRSKMAVIRRAIILKQRTAVWQTLSKNQGVVTVKMGNIKAVLSSTNLCSSKPAINEVQSIPQPEKLLRSNLRTTLPRMKQRQICSRNALHYQPCNPFVCNVCFLNTGLPETNSQDELEDKPIILTSVYSLASSPLQHANMEETPTTNEDAKQVSSADREVEYEKEETEHGKMVSARTTNGFVKFVVPMEFENETDEFKLVSGQMNGTANDPIVIDDN